MGVRTNIMAAKPDNHAIYDLHDKPPFLTWLGLSLQHLFSMFGATVLVPLLVGLNPGAVSYTHLTLPTTERV